MLEMILYIYMVAEETSWIKLVLDQTDQMDFKNPNIC